ncbi:MAG: TRAP transporter large permease subunit [Spirochaetales bacterium]
MGDSGESRNGILRRVESLAASGSLLVLALLPIAEMLVRLVGFGGIPGYSGYAFHLVLFTAFLGGMVTAREGRHLAIKIAVEAMPARARSVAETASAFLSTMLGIAFFWSSLSFVAVGFEPGARVGFLPVQFFAAVMPVGFLVMTGRFLLRTPATVSARLVAIVGLVGGTFIGFSAIADIVYWYAPTIPPLVDAVVDVWYRVMPLVAIPSIIALIAGAFLGVPLFVVLGGAALLLFARVGGALAVVANEGYVMLTGNTIPAIPIFTLVGFLLSESKAGERLVHLFRSLFGWMPGGLVIAAIVASAFFTTFTGASGVTILALGGLLLYVLVHSGNHESGFSTGILTASGSLGLLFPPSLALIVYGSVAQVSIFDLFLGGILPGVLLVLAMSAVAVVVSIRRKVPSVPFNGSDAWSALKESIWEILLPVLVVVVYFSGIATLIQTAAVAVAYTLVVEMVIRREVRLRRLPEVTLKAIVIIGGVLMILALARALSYYIIDTRLPIVLRDWVEATIGSRFVFLLLVNIVLLAAGMFMDIFSAILVIAPLLIPLAAVFGVDPVHLGVVFVANMGIGFITPPVGLNLFLASYRFEQPLGRIYRNVAPFFLLQFGIVLVITYWPWLSTALVGG